MQPNTTNKRPHMSQFGATIFALMNDMNREYMNQSQKTEPRDEDLKEVEVLAVRDVKE